MSELNISIGQRIQALRKRKGINQTELATLIGKNMRTIQKYESGEIEISVSVINEIAQILDSTPAYILGYEKSNITIGEKIKVFRKQLGITQNELAELTGIHPVSIRKYETNKMKPQLSQIEKLVKVFGINLTDFLDSKSTFNDSVFLLIKENKELKNTNESLVKENEKLVIKIKELENCIETIKNIIR